jgi:hypothetical protein
VFAVADAVGSVYIYDLKQEMFSPLVTIPTNKDKTAVTALCFNENDASILTSVDEKGRITVWQLSGGLSSLQEGEMQMIQKLGDAV